MSDKRIFTVGPAPHWRSPGSVTRMNLAYLLALLPTVVLGAVGHAYGEKTVQLSASFGPMNKVIEVLVVEMGLDSGALWLLGILGTCALAAGLGALVEYLAQVAMRQPYRATDGHGALMGLLVALLMPPSVPGWVLLIGVVAAVVVGKQLYGGIGGYPMHPAVVGWLILLLSWPNHMYPVGAASIAAPDTLAVLGTLAGGLLRWALGYIRPQIVLGTLAGVVVFSLLFAGRLKGGPVDQLLTGHVMLGAFFIATDATSSPANRRAMWVYGLGTGFMIMLIRAFGIWADAVPFAIILMNILNPLLDRWRPRVREAVA